MTDASRVPAVQGQERTGVGVAAILGAALCTSLSGVLIRSVEEADGWQILFWRSIACIATMLVFILWRHGAKSGDAFLRIGRTGLWLALCQASAFIFFIFAMLQTTVANVAFTVGMAPLFAALLAWLLLRERITGRTTILIALSLVGIGLMFGDGVAAGTLAGNVLALATCLFYSATIVLLRGGRRVDMIPAVTIAAALSCIPAAILAPSGLAIGGRDVILIGVMGVVQLALQYILFTVGVRHLPAAQAALIGRAAVVMTPLWAWLGVGEVPSALSLAGGGFVLLAVMGQGFIALLRSRKGAADRQRQPSFDQPS